MNPSGKMWRLVAWFVLLDLMEAAAVAGDWPAFRGPEGNGIAQVEQAPLHWARGLNVRWKAPLPGPGNSSPIISRGRVFVTCAGSEGKKRNLYSFDCQTGEQLWVRMDEFTETEPVVVDGRVYIVNAGPGTAQCIECQTGKIQWTERLDGGESWSSVVLAAGRCYVTSRRGVTTVFRANPDKFELLAVNDLGEPSNATPAISDGQIILRTDANLYCISGD